MPLGNHNWKSVYRVVRRIPEGRVATYGQVAALAGMPRAARQVGWALHALCEADDVPWQRVINARGEISTRPFREVEGLQRALLQSEGVVFDAAGRVDLSLFAWQPKGVASKTRKKRKTRQNLSPDPARKNAKKRGEQE